MYFFPNFCPHCVKVPKPLCEFDHPLGQFSCQPGENSVLQYKFFPSKKYSCGRVVVQISNFHCYIRGFWSEISPEIVVGVLFFLSINHTLVLCMISPKNNKNNWCKVKLGITQCSKNAKSYVIYYIELIISEVYK